MFICQICNRECKNYISLGTHIIRTHHISSQIYYNEYMKKENDGFCIECGKSTTFINLCIGYRKFCSVICSRNSKLTQEKQKETNLKKYGCENIAQNFGIKEKIKQTNLKRYGASTPFENEIVKEKIKKTNLEKYGTERPIQNKEIQEKIKQTNLKKYGYENASQNDEIKEKKKQTNLKNYGCEYPLQSPELQNKLKKTNLEKYGYSHFMQNYTIKEKLYNKWVSEFNEKLKKYNILYVDKDDRNYKLKCAKCGNEFSFAKSTVYRFIENNIDCCPYCNSRNDGTSLAEKELLDYIKSIYNGKIIENERTVLNGLELDIFIPDLKLAFEYNGLYWHSIDYKNKNYHLNKTEMCEKQGIQLIHVFENTWFEKENKIKEYIKELINGKINLNNSLVFKIENNTIFVDRKYCNGKPFEDMHYKLIEIIKPLKQYITFNNNSYEIYDCGKLIYEKL